MVLKGNKRRPDNWLATTILLAAALLVYGVLKVRSDRHVGRAERTQDKASSDV